MNAISKELMEKMDAFLNIEGKHLVVNAGAGTGKTTTMIDGIKYVRGVKPSITPSEQQQAIWDALSESSSEADIAVMAFSKAISVELEDRIRGMAGVSASTMHAMGNKIVIKSFGRLKKPNTWRVTNIIGELLDKDTREISRTPKGRAYLKAVNEMVGLCKQNLVDGEDPEALDALAAHYDVDLNGSREKIYEIIPKVLERCKDVKKDREIDFNDMIWLPVVLDLKADRFSILMVDEAQDLNLCQQALAMKLGERLILVGDNNQAIFGFAGADSESLPRMTSILESTGRGCQTLPLNETRRCGKKIVELAQQIVPEFYAHESNPEGIIDEASYNEGENCYRNFVEDGAMIICRVNAPLVQQCFRFIKEGRKATIQGRDIGQGLVSLVKKMKTQDVNELVEKLETWYQAECRKESSKRNPSEAKLISLQDKYNCLEVFLEGALSVQEVIDNITAIFNDNKGFGIKLSSVHRAKGLEADHVYILMPEAAPMPHPLAKSEWQYQQEMNLKYVAITRAKNHLTWVVE